MGNGETGKPDEIENDGLRYTLTDQLGSSQLELNAKSEVINYESYYPYGGTAIWATKNVIEASYQFIRYSGKEQDATGFYYYGYRYYLPWLGRWLNPDPSGIADGLNLFRMVKNNPITFYDTDGKQPVDVTDLEPDLVKEVEGAFMTYRVARIEKVNNTSLGIFTSGITDCLGVGCIIRDKADTIQHISLIHSMSEHSPDYLREEKLQSDSYDNFLELSMKEFPNFDANLRYALSGISEGHSLEIVLHGGSAYKTEVDEISMVEEYIKKYQEVNKLEFLYYFNNEEATFKKEIISTFLGITLEGNVFIDEEVFVENILLLKNSRESSSRQVQVSNKPFLSTPLVENPEAEEASSSNSSFLSLDEIDRVLNQLSNQKTTDL